jgi:outer membrane murein-binding lipoprotein Lpp
MIRGSLLVTAAVAALLALSGCNKAESPDKVASDVAKATASAEKKDERAEQSAEKTDATVTNDLSKDVDKANQKEVHAAADDAVTQAEGENKIALAKCEALAGDAQKSCKDQANAELDMVKQRAKALKSDRG